jgi:serine/threonine-protein kinase RsbW
VTDLAPVQGDPPPENDVFLRLAAGPLAGPVLCRVTSMVLARAHCPMDKLDDAMIVCDAISAHAASYARDGYIVFTIVARPGELTLRVAELADEGARKLVRDAAVPGLGNVLERMADELHVEASPNGLPEELVLALSFR